MADEPLRHGWVWWVYVALFAAAIPWYFPPEAARPTRLGFPLWVCVSLAATLGVALFTVFVIRRYWEEGDTDDAGGPPEP